MSAFDSALRSPGNPSALAGNVGGQSRVQEVLSPPFIIDAAREALGGEIGIDPCASTNPANWRALVNLTIPPEVNALEVELVELAGLKSAAAKSRRAALRKLLEPHRAGHGVAESWGSIKLGAYVNPPFDELRRWMERVQLEGVARACVGLYPVRPHRPWWARACASGEVVFLEYNVKFVGHACAFPAPLCLVSYGCRIPDLGKRETGRWDRRMVEALARIAKDAP